MSSSKVRTTSEGGEYHLPRRIVFVSVVSGEFIIVSTTGNSPAPKPESERLFGISCSQDKVNWVWLLYDDGQVVVNLALASVEGARDRS